MSNFNYTGKPADLKPSFVRHLIGQLDDSRQLDDLGTMMLMSIILKISLIQTEDMVLAETAKYLLKEELKDHGDDAITATRKILVRMANRIVSDMEDGK